VSLFVSGGCFWRIPVHPVTPGGSDWA
jgi:hypothetical protein